MDTKKRSICLDVARVIAVISISLNHAVNRTFQNYSGQQAEFLSIPLWSTLIKTGATIFSKLGVPLFLMISGALLLNKRMDGPADVKRFYRHNLLDLLITAEIWYVLMYWCRLILGIGGTSLSDIGIPQAFIGMFKTMLFLDQNTFDSMWYMPMILCLYTTLPFLIMAKEKLKGAEHYLLLPTVLVFLYSMVIPSLNALTRLLGGTATTVTIREADLLSYFYTYLLAGYFLNAGKLRKLKDLTVIIIGLLSFLVCCSFQLYAYSLPREYLIGYDFPLLIICAGAIFEYIRRKADRLQRFRQPITYLSRISLGIYFVHIIIMTGMTWLLADLGRTQLWRLLLLEIGSVGLSVVIIAVLSRLRLFRRYLFLIK